jgi:Heterokaryon incompatibility protein (HET)
MKRKCIIQDDRDDWAKEAPKMGYIYEHAHVTLSASAASNGDMGLFAPLQHSEIVKLPCDADDPSKGDMYFTPQDISFNEVRKSPLNSRGWVLQERVLSRRTVFFAATQVYWECCMEYLAEDKSRHNSVGDASQEGGLMRQAVRKYTKRTRSNIPGDPHQYLDVAQEHYLPRSYGAAYMLQNCWRDLVTRYSQCGLTVPDDKLSALSGLATRIQTATTIHYQFGHFFDIVDGSYSIEAVQSLLWTPSRVPLTTRATRRAPSWSWAALNGPLEFLLDELEISRLEVKPDDLKILSIVQNQPSQSSQQSYLSVSGFVKAASRCDIAHDPPPIKLHSTPHPRSRYYDIGPLCVPLFDWYCTIRNEAQGLVQDIQQVNETMLIQFPQNEPFPNPDNTPYERPADYGVPLDPPGVGWICFDSQETEPESFYLALVCTRDFYGPRRRKGLQYIALALRRQVDTGTTVRYQRIGVAQVHFKGWFNDAMQTQFLLE